MLLLWDHEFCSRLQPIRSCVFQILAYQKINIFWYLSRQIGLNLYLSMISQIFRIYKFLNSLYNSKNLVKIQLKYFIKLYFNQVAKYQDSHIMYNPTIFNSQPNTRIKFYENERKKRDIEEGDDVINNNDAEDEMSEKIERKKREAEAEKDVESEQISSLAHMQIPQTARESRSWCEDSFGVFCMLFNAMKAEIFTSLDYKKTI